MVAISVCHPEGVTGVGNTPCDVMGIGIAPGRTEWNRTKTPFTGPAGTLLKGTLKAVGFPEEDIFLTNLICWWEDEPTENDVEKCADRLAFEIATVNPKVIILFGNIVSDHFLGHKKWKRGRAYWVDNRWLIPTWHPASFLHVNPEKKTGPDIADFARDLKKLKHYVEMKGPHIPPSFRVCETVEEANEVLHNLEGLCSIDIESSYNDLPFKYPDIDLVQAQDGKLLSFAVSSNKGTWVIPGKLAGKLRKGWGDRASVQWAMWLGMFDKAKLKAFLGEILTIAEDGLLQSYSLDERGGASEEDERSVGIHGLKQNAAEWLGAPEYDVSVLEAGYDELHAYNASDAAYTLQLVEFFREEQIRDSVREMYLTFLIPGANALSEIQDYGVYIDKKVLNRLGAKWAERWLELSEELQTIAKNEGWGKDTEHSTWKKDRWSEDFLDLGSWQALQHFLYDIKKLKPHPIFKRSTRKEVLEWHAERGDKWCQVMQEWRGVDHILNAYVVGVEDDIKWDGRVHPQPLLHGSRGGRLSYKKPPIQTLPKHGVDPDKAEIRAMFSVENTDTHCIIEADKKQAELWATAYLSGDENLLSALQGGDAHGDTAKEVFEVDENHPLWKAMRELAKMINFGTLYNRTADGYAKNMWQGRKPPSGLEGYKWTRKQAQAFIDKWFAARPKIKIWQKEEIKKAISEGEQQTITGRKRRYWLTNWKTVNQAVNLGPQSVAHDFLFMELLILHQKLKEFDAHILFEVHDALVIEARKDRLKETVACIREVMSAPKFGLGGIPVDVAVGPNWHEVKKYEEDLAA